MYLCADHHRRAPSEPVPPCTPRRREPRTDVPISRASGTFGRRRRCNGPLPWPSRPFSPKKRLPRRRPAPPRAAPVCWNRARSRTEPLPAGGGGLAVGGYNDFWLDYGTNVIEDRRTSLIVDPPDGRLPPLTDEGEALRQVGSLWEDLPIEHPVRVRSAGTGSDRPEDRGLAERCLVGFNSGPPLMPSGYNNNMQLFQTEDHVVILTEMVHDARIIPLDDRPHLPAGVRQWMGDSRGRWEGRHARRRDDELHGQDGELRSVRDPVDRNGADGHADRAVLPSRRRHAALRVHRPRPHGLHPTVQRVPCRCAATRLRCSSTPVTKATTGC